MCPIKSESIFSIHFATSLNANKVGKLRIGKRSGICFTTDENNIALMGTAEILIDQETKGRYWADWLIDVYPDGETDPDYCITSFVTEHVFLWIDGERAEFTIEEFLGVQSRCGLLCKWCTFRKSHGCWVH